MRMHFEPNSCNILTQKHSLFTLCKFSHPSSRVCYRPQSCIANSGIRKWEILHYSTLFLNFRIYKNKAQQANDASMGILSTWSTLSTFSTLSTPSTFSNVNVGLSQWFSWRKPLIFSVLKKNGLRTNHPTDHPTDRPTDMISYIEMRGRI